MELKFMTERWQRLAYESEYTAGLPRPVVRAFRARIQAIKAAPQEQVLLALGEWLQLRKSGDQPNLYCMPVTDDWQLLLAFQDGDDERVAVIEAMVKLEQQSPQERHR
jgi:plasmid maintenance system killer protein